MIDNDKGDNDDEDGDDNVQFNLNDDDDDDGNDVHGDDVLIIIEYALIIMTLISILLLEPTNIVGKFLTKRPGTPSFAFISIFPNFR
jgi:hypothetical protein